MLFDNKTKQQKEYFFQIDAHLCVFAWLQMTNCSIENVDRLNRKIKMPKLWSCIAPKNDEEKKREQINKQINAKLKQDEKIYKATYRLLLLGLLSIIFISKVFIYHFIFFLQGAGESGKSTVVKQMKILHNPFTTQ